MDKYEAVRDIGSGNFGVARLMRNRETRELVAVKCIERGHRIDENVYREIINHRSLRHPNIIRFKEVILTPTHLMIVMEFAAGGELFDRICDRGRFSEDEARYFFQQLICGVSYCHYMQICHRDLKLENVLLDGSPAPRLKICDFGYSKSSVLHSRPKSAVGTPAYIAPEVLSRREYDGKTLPPRRRRTPDDSSPEALLDAVPVSAIPGAPPTIPGAPANHPRSARPVPAVLPAPAHASGVATRPPAQRCSLPARCPDVRAARRNSFLHGAPRQIPPRRHEFPGTAMRASPARLTRARPAWAAPSLVQLPARRSPSPPRAKRLCLMRKNKEILTSGSHTS